MASYTFTTTSEQEMVLGWALRRRRAGVTSPGSTARCPSTNEELLLEWLATALKPYEDAYQTLLQQRYLEELSTAPDTDTRAQILARAEARMTT